ncbi:MAG: glycosyltransferase family 39 protein [Planctomycetota bacterium]|nr:glycosyltransferase family 39 protein [Planctomycetota bacterium]
MKLLRHPNALAVWLPAFLVLITRIIFQGFIFPTELSGDEAQYWDWSRHLELSYYTKGPGVTLIIAFFTGLLGDHQFAVRLGSYLAHALTAIAVGVLGTQFCGNSRRVVWLTSIGFQCILGYQIGGSLMTVDMPMVLGWSVATVCAVSSVQRARQQQSVRWPLTIMGAALGFSFLAKYTALLAVLGLLMGIWPWRKLILRAPGAKQGAGFGGSLLLAAMAPVVIWNAQRGWPTIQHLLGHIAVPGGDSGVISWTEFEIAWPLTYILQTIALPGPLLAVAMGLGILSWKRGQWDRPRPELRVALCSALPLLLFYLLVSFKGETEGNWTAAAAAPLLPFAAIWIDRHYKMRSTLWLRSGILLRSTLSLFLLLTLPWSAPPLSKGLLAIGSDARIPLHRVHGHRQFAIEVRRLAVEALGESGERTPIICDYYDRTALLAFSLPDQPVVHCASVQLGARRSAYDDLAATRFTLEAFSDQDLILVGADEKRWRNALDPVPLIELGTALQRGRPRKIFHARIPARPIENEH